MPSLGLGEAAASSVASGFTLWLSQMQRGKARVTNTIMIRLCCALLLGSAIAAPAQLSKGHLILIKRGLQVQGMVTRDDVFHLNTYSNANYTSIHWLWTSSMSAAFPWSRWVSDESNMPPVSGEAPYMKDLVTLQLGDEWNLNDAALRTRAVN